MTHGKNARVSSDGSDNMNAKNEIILQWHRCCNNCKKRNHSLIYLEHFFCVFLISFMVVASLILVAGGQAFAIFEEIKTKIAVQSEFPQIDENAVFSKSITPQMFGAVGDGERDDTKAFLALSSFCNENPGTSVFIPEGHYIILEPLSITADVSIRGSGTGSYLDFTQITDKQGAALEISGNYCVLGQLEKPQEKGNYFLVDPNTAKLTVGDIVAILDPVEFSWNKMRSYYRKGEFCEVRSVRDGRAELAYTLCDDYASGCQLLLMEMVRCEVSGLCICVQDRGDEKGMTPLRLSRTRDSHVRDVTVYGSNYAQIDVKHSYNVLLDHILADYICNVNLGLNYGISICNSQFIYVMNSVMNALRHGMAIGGGSEEPYVVNRFITITDSTINSRESTSADIHENAQYIRYDRCIFLNGMDLGGCDITVNNCDIFSGETQLWAYIKPMQMGTMNITENHFHALDTYYHEDSFLFSVIFESNTNHEQESMIRLDGNVFDVCGRKTIRFNALECPNQCTLLMTDNVINSGSVCLENICKTIVDGNITQAGFLFMDAEYLGTSSTESIIFTNNTLSNVDGYGIQIQLPFFKEPLIKISSNIFNKTKDVAVKIDATNNMHVRINGNTYINCDAGSLINQE